jgi:O-antigen biosynthesis protein
MSERKRVLLTIPAAPKQSPFSTSEKRPPLGVGFLISVLRNASHKVFFIDNYLQPEDFLESGYLWKNKIDFVGIHANTICFRDTLRMLHKIQYFRHKGKWNGKIIVGGPQTTVAPDTIPEFVDYIVQGEGEFALLDIIEGRVADRIVKYPIIENLDDLPMPAWDYFARLPYDWSVDWFEKKPVFTMNTSRGCPFGCTFCSVGSIWGKKYTYFSASRLVNEIEYLIKHYRAKGIYFREDNFTLNRNRLLEFCNLLIEKNLNISWACETRVNTIDRETVNLMYRSGARAFYFGVESGSQRILDFLNKGITIDQIKNAFTLCHETGIRTAASVIVGVPSEKEEDIIKTEKLLEEIKPTVTWYNVFVGIPNSELYRYVLDNNLDDFVDDRGLVYLKGHNNRVKRFYGNAWDSEIPTDLSHPKISVIMSVRNGERYIEPAIKSILSQSNQNFEFIIIDDASTDRTPEILKNLKETRIQVHTNETNQGLTKSLNKGISFAKGKYIARMDADDISLPHRFDTQADFLDNNLDYALVGSSYYQIDDADKIVSVVNVLTDNSSLKKGLKKQNWFAHGSVMMRKSAFVDVGGYDDCFELSQDYDLWIRIAKKYKVSNIKEPLYLWRCTNTGISSIKHEKQDIYARLAVSKASKVGNLTMIPRESQPLVSVIIPTYNRPTMLAEAVRSVLNQTYRNFEIIVVNDSGVNVENTLIPLNRNGNIVYVKHSKNRGLAATRNTGITLSKGKYIAYLDDDDIYLPHHVESLVSFLENTYHKIAYSDAHRAFQHKQGHEYVISKKDTPFSFDFDCDRILTENFIPILCVIHEKECLQKVGVFDETLRRMEDWDLWIRMSRHYEFAHIKEVTCEFRWRNDGTSMMTGPIDAFAWATMNIFYKYKDFVKNNPKIIRTHEQVITDTIATLKRSMTDALTSNPFSQLHISFGVDFDSVVSRLSELRGEYLQHSDDIDELITLSRRIQEIINQNRKHGACKNQFNSLNQFEPESSDGIDIPTSLSDQLTIKDEYISSLERRIQRLNIELSDIQKSNGWRLLTKYYKTRNLLTNRKK